MSDITPDTPNQTTANIIITKPKKSVIVAFFLTFFFGPLGLLYTSVGGGIFMIICAIILVPITGGLAAILIWPSAIIWAILKVLLSKSEASA